MYNIHDLYIEIDKLTDAFIKKYYPTSTSYYWVGGDNLGTLHVYDTVFWGLEDMCRIMQYSPTPEDLELYFDYLLRTDDIDRMGEIRLITFLEAPDKYRALLYAEIKVEELREKVMTKAKATPTVIMPQF